MNELIVFTDGSCLGNGKKVTFAGYGIYFPNNEFEDVSEPFTIKPVTNQRAELYAILHVFNLVIYDKLKKLTIYTDSDYSIKSITKWAFKWKQNGWKTKKGSVKNLDIIKPLFKIYCDNKDKIILKHVKAHTSNQDYYSLGNAQADRLAVLGSKQSIAIIKKPNRKTINIKQKQLTESSSSSEQIENIRVIIKRKKKKKVLRISKRNKTYESD